MLPGCFNGFAASEHRIPFVGVKRCEKKLPMGLSAHSGSVVYHMLREV
jgi:hypothetical protein